MNPLLRIDDLVHTEDFQNQVREICSRIRSGDLKTGSFLLVNKKNVEAISTTTSALSGKDSRFLRNIYQLEDFGGQWSEVFNKGYEAGVNFAYSILKQYPEQLYILSSLRKSAKLSINDTEYRLARLGFKAVMNTDAPVNSLEYKLHLAEAVKLDIAKLEAEAFQMGFETVIETLVHNVQIALQPEGPVVDVLTIDPVGRPSIPLAAEWGQYSLLAVRVAYFAAVIEQMISPDKAQNAFHDTAGTLLKAPLTFLPAGSTELRWIHPTVDNFYSSQQSIVDYNYRRLDFTNRAEQSNFIPGVESPEGQAVLSRLSQVAPVLFSSISLAPVDTTGREEDENLQAFQSRVEATRPLLAELQMTDLYDLEGAPNLDTFLKNQPFWFSESTRVGNAKNALELEKIRRTFYALTEVNEKDRKFVDAMFKHLQA